MYHPNKTQPDQGMASMQRTFYPKHCHYFGSGCGRDAFIILNNGGFNRVDKANLGNQGVHMKQYNSSVTRRVMPTPRKEATTFYYQSDGTGRDSYVLKNNGGLRMEYEGKGSGDRMFRESLRSSEDFRRTFNIHRANDKSDITNYLNWSSTTGRHQNKQFAKINREVTERLASGSPQRGSSIKYKIGATSRDNSFAEIDIPNITGDYKQFNHIIKKNFRRQLRNNNLALNNSKFMVTEYDNKNGNESPMQIIRKNNFKNTNQNSRLDLSMQLDQSQDQD
jgi:hypothetical protein